MQISGAYSSVEPMEILHVPIEMGVKLGARFKEGPGAKIKERLQDLRRKKVEDRISGIKALTGGSKEVKTSPDSSDSLTFSNEDGRVSLVYWRPTAGIESVRKFSLEADRNQFGELANIQATVTDYDDGFTDHEVFAYSPEGQANTMNFDTVMGELKLARLCARANYQRYKLRPSE